MAKSKSTLIKIRNDMHSDENLLFDGDKLDIVNDKNNNNLLINDKQEINYKNNNNANTINSTNINNNNNGINNNNNNNFIPMQTINQNNDVYEMGPYHQMNNFNDGYVYDDLSLLPLIDDKSIVANLKSKFENQKYYVIYNNINLCFLKKNIKNN